MSDSLDSLKATLATLRESEGAYRRLVELSPDMVLLCSESGAIRYINLAGSEILGFGSPVEVTGKDLLDFVAPAARDRVRGRLTDSSESTPDIAFAEERFIRADGQAFDAEMMAVPSIYQGEHVVHLVVRDITRRKEAEAQQRRLKRRLLLTFVFSAIVIFSFTAYYAYQYSESVEFCGMLCHSVMAPRYVEHRASPHAHVSCAQCHIGAGAAWYVKAKFSGLHQAYATLMKTYPNPIQAPIVNLRPAVETCEHCHSRSVFHGDWTRVFRSLEGDATASDPQISAVTLHIGGAVPGSGKYTGIHWHSDPSVTIEYRALDPQRLKIAEIRLTDRIGPPAVFTSSQLPSPAAGSPWRQMDCCDCHNRVSHRHQTPAQAVDSLIFAGRLNGSLPDVRQAALATLESKYPTMAAAREGILRQLRQFYRNLQPGASPDVPPGLPQLARVLYQEAYAVNVDPDLKIDWDTYPDHLDHTRGEGCFRCHDGEHRTAAGRTIRQDCDLCHAVLVDGERQSRIDPTLRRVLFFD